MFGIFGTQYPQIFRHLPIDRQIRVVEQNTAVRLRMIEVVAFIGEDSLIAQHREPVRKTARNIELPFVLFAQLYAEPLPVGRLSLRRSTATSSTRPTVQHTNFACV